MVDWDDYFMTMVYLVASKSKDESSHLGAVVVGPKNEVRSVGYNSFPRGLNDNVSERQEIPEKYFWHEHAERNAIYNATLIGVSLEGCRIYANGIPCADCARGIIQSGIKEVIVDKKWEWDNSRNPLKWQEEVKRSLEMFEEVRVGLRYYEGNFVEVNRFCGGKKTSLR